MGNECSYHLRELEAKALRFRSLKVDSRDLGKFLLLHFDFKVLMLC